MARIRSIKPEFWTSAGVAWPHDCSVYLIQEEGSGPVKIGIANHPVRRLQMLQNGNPRRLNLCAVYCGSRHDCKFVEGAIKFRFSPHFMSGEWMALSLEELMHEIETSFIWRDAA